jgi:hypothetical protein
MARLGLLLTCLPCLALAVASPTAAQEPERRTAVAEAAAAPTGITPLIGDLDGDTRSDVFMYGPGSLPDHVWLGRPDRAFWNRDVGVYSDSPFPPSAAPPCASPRSSRSCPTSPRA